MKIFETFFGLIGLIAGIGVIVILLSVEDNSTLDIQTKSNGQITNTVYEVTRASDGKQCTIIFFENEMYIPVSIVEQPSYDVFMITNQTIHTFFTFGSKIATINHE